MSTDLELLMHYRREYEAGEASAALDALRWLLRNQRTLGRTDRIIAGEWLSSVLKKAIAGAEAGEDFAAAFGVKRAKGAHLKRRALKSDQFAAFFPLYRNALRRRSRRPIEDARTGVPGLGRKIAEQFVAHLKLSRAPLSTKSKKT